MSKTLLETCVGGGRIDRQAGIIFKVKILGKESANRRTYSDQALRDAARLYEGARVNVNHDRQNPNRERGIAEEFGTLRNVSRCGNGVYGDLHFLKSHPLADLVIEKAERFPDKIGLSHNADGQSTVKLSGHEVVESIRRVNSVDLVLNPATNRGLFESRRDEIEYPKTNDEFCASLRGNYRPLTREILESDADNLPAMGKAVAKQSAEVDAAVSVSLNELLPSATIAELRRDAKLAFKRIYETGVNLVTKDESLAASEKTAVIRKLLDAQEKAADAFDAIVAPLDVTEPTPEQRKAQAKDDKLADKLARDRGEKLPVFESRDSYPRSVKDFARSLR
jgi:hypothetical protein